MTVTKAALEFDASDEYTSHAVESPWGPLLAYFVDSETLYLQSPNRASGGTRINGIPLEFTMRLSPGAYEKWAPDLVWNARLDKSFAKCTAGQMTKIYDWAREFAATTWIADHSSADGRVADIRNKRQELVRAAEKLQVARLEFEAVKDELHAMEAM